MQTIDTSELINAVRHDQRSPDFEVLNWTRTSLTDKGATNAGLYCYSGQGRDQFGERSWSVILKVIRESERVTTQDDRFYWKREILTYQSGLLDGLLHPIRVPRIYGMIQGEHDAPASKEEFRIWMEHIQETTPERWSLEQYMFAAHQLGCFHGSNTTGTSIPEYPWLCRNAIVSWLKLFNPERGWDNAFVKRYIAKETRNRMMQIWADRDRLINILDCLPQTFSHLDFKRDNLLIRDGASGQKELVVLDWERCGMASLGADLASLVGSSCLFFNWEPADAQRLEEATMTMYLAGLREMGWQDDTNSAQLGYFVWIGLFYGVIMSSVISSFTAEEAQPPLIKKLGLTADELASGWASLGEFALIRAEQAFGIAGRYGLL